MSAYVNETRQASSNGFKAHLGRLFHGGHAPLPGGKVIAPAGDPINDLMAAMTKAHRGRIVLPMGHEKDAVVNLHPREDGTCRLDSETLRQHVLIVGEQGSGKRRLLRKVLDHALTVRWNDSEGNYVRGPGAFVLGGGGTLWRDLLQSPAIQARMKDDPNSVVVVGTGTYEAFDADGQPETRQMAGLDLLKGRTPGQIAACFWLSLIGWAAHLSRAKRGC